MNQPLQLTGVQKAAAILVAMGKPAAGRLLKFFKQEELKGLIEGARMLRSIPQSELERIVSEFESEFTEGAGLIDSGDALDTIIAETLTPEEVEAIVNPRLAGIIDTTLPLWPQVEALESRTLSAFLASEHPQTVALVLSSISAQAAAPVLLALDKAVRGDVVKRMLALGTVTPAARRLLEDGLRLRLINAKPAPSGEAGQLRIVNLLNELDKTELNEVMADFEAAGGSNVETIRSKLFSFEDVLFLSQKSRVALFDGLSSDIVTNALRGASAELTEAVLSALGARARRMIESELSSDSGNVSAGDVARARRTIASSAVKLSAEGSLELPAAKAA